MYRFCQTLSRMGVLLLLLGIAIGFVFAQERTGELNGTARDQSRAVGVLSASLRRRIRIAAQAGITRAKSRPEFFPGLGAATLQGRDSPVDVIG